MIFVSHFLAPIGCSFRSPAIRIGVECMAIRGSTTRPNTRIVGFVIGVGKCQFYQRASWLRQNTSAEEDIGSPERFGPPADVVRARPQAFENAQLWQFEISACKGCPVRTDSYQA